MKKNEPFGGSLCLSLKKTLLIMRIAFILLLVGFLQTMANNAYSQKTKLSMDYSNAELVNVLDQIENQTDFFFLYNEKLIDTNRKVTISVKEQGIEEVLKSLFAGTDVRYSIIDRKIILSPTDAPVSSQQQKTVSGKVTDATGGPLPGVTIVVKGTTVGKITDAEGNYSFTNLPANAVLQFSFVGMQSQEVKVGSQGIVNVTLKDQAVGIEEVVAVGYGTQKKVNLTGAVNVVKMDKALGTRPVVSTSQALQGSVPGLQITTNVGNPGQAMTLNIRGTNRLNIDKSGDGQPLVLVDNVPMDINMIDPNDIETVSVLKDAASTAIYGARAAFGVVLITTKKGKKGEKARINYNNNFVISKSPEVFEKPDPLTYVTTLKAINPKSPAYSKGQNIDRWIALLNDFNSNPGNYPLGFFVDTDGKRYDLKATDHYKNLMENGFQQNHSVSVEGGNEKSTYRFSGGMVDENGILVTNKDSYKRYNLSTNINTEINQWISTEVDMKYSTSETDYPNLSTLKSWPVFRIATLLPSYYPEGNAVYAGDGQTYPIATPRWTVENSPVQPTNIDNTRLFGRVVLKPVKDLVINAEYTFNQIAKSVTTYNNGSLQYLNADKANFTLEKSSAGSSSYKQTKTSTKNNAINIYGSYNKTLWNKHHFSIMSGFNQEYYYTEDLWGQKLNVIIPDLPSLSGANGTQTAGDTHSEYAMRGVFYRFNYDLDNKYLLEVNGRGDWSSKFPSTNNFGFFPSVSAGWVVSKERFMEWSSHYLNNLKLRASWGSIGNQDIKNYAYLSQMSLANKWLSNGSWVQGYNVPSLVSDSFTWETVQTLDLGVDVSMFNSRFSGMFDWYQRDTKNMLAQGTELPGVLGEVAPGGTVTRLDNAANLSTKGWELSLSWRDNINKDWSYGLSFNLYDSRTFVTKMDSNPNGLLTNSDGTVAYRKGQQIGEIWGLVTDRYYTADDFATLDEANGVYVLKSGVPILASDAAVRNVVRPGDILYKNFNSTTALIEAKGANTVSDPGDRKIIGNNLPRYVYSINANIGWKGLELSLFFRGVGKRDISDWYANNGASIFWPHVNVNNANESAAILNHELDYWTYDRPNAFYPRLGSPAGTWQGTDPYNRIQQSKYVMNGAFIRLQNVTLSYSLPKSLLNKSGFIQSCKVFVTGENVWKKDHLFTGMDPELVNNDTQMYPFAKKYSFGLNVTF